LNTRPLRVLLTGALTGFFLVCLVFLGYRLNLPYPGAVTDWLAGNDWLMWTATAGTLFCALVLAPLVLVSRTRGAGYRDW
jgi:preprotein translocase subunit SecG